ncbi:MAG TPA: hypothetical protein VEK57_04500 [Thermoanaerobaculia bacterium]|nr:hypothetical protein [Thermoanaerobaculia bacterium]
MSDEPAHELVRMIEGVDWDVITPKLLIFAQFCLARHRLRHGANGETAHDYVTRAVYELLDGKHPSVDGTLFQRLCTIISGSVRFDAAGAGAA